MAQEDKDQDQDNELPQDEDIDQGEMKMSKTKKMIKIFGIKDHRTRESTKIEDALRDPDCVVEMQEELNNFTRNEVCHLVPCPNQNVVGTK
jgi:hypothetical protein